MLEQPDVRPINTREWELYEDYTYMWSDDRRDKLTPLLYRLTIKKGFITDLASIPKCFWWFESFQPDGLHRAAALVHDFLYQHRGRIILDDLMGHFEFASEVTGKWQAIDHIFTRADCDRLFLKLMQDAGESAGTAKTMFYAVRLFGGLAW